MIRIVLCILMFAATILGCSYVAACRLTGNEQEIPQAVKQKVAVLYPGASAIEWEKERKGYEAEFVLDGKKISLLLDSKGNLLSSVKMIDENELPAVIAADLKKREGIRITRMQLQEANGAAVYKVTGVSPDKRLRLEYSAEGKVLNELVIDKERKQRMKISLPSGGLAGYTGKWELPFILTEVSGIALINDSTVACVQDELAVIYIYDLGKKKIVSEIPFAGPGDYEGIAVVNEDAWVLRSDGRLYEIRSFLKSPSVKEHTLQFSTAQNLEGLCYDPVNRRLLIAPREFDTADSSKKGIYSFDPGTGQFSGTPVLTLDLTDSIFRSVHTRKGKAPLIPSEIAVHPATGKIYITDARNAQLLILQSNGEIEKLLPLDKNVFAKTEGLAFTPQGRMYLSNEGKKARPNILQLEPGKHFPE